MFVAANLAVLDDTVCCVNLKKGGVGNVRRNVERRACLASVCVLLCAVPCSKFVPQLAEHRHAGLVLADPQHKSGRLRGSEDCLHFVHEVVEACVLGVDLWEGTRGQMSAQEPSSGDAGAWGALTCSRSDRTLCSNWRSSAASSRMRPL